MALIPTFLNQRLLEADGNCVCIVSTILADGYCQLALRGSVHVYDQDTLAYWDRGGGTMHDTVIDGAKITVFYRNGALSASSGSGLLPRGGAARFYGIAEVHKDDSEIRDRVWNGMKAVERERDPEKTGWAVLVELESAEQLNRTPLAELQNS